MRRFAANGIQGMISLYGEGAIPNIRVTLIEFSVGDPNRVKLDIIQARDKRYGPPGDLMLPREATKLSDAGVGHYHCWLSEGDHIESNEWDLELKRIILPDAKGGIRGWADFYLNPEPSSIKKSRD
jgi:hypothetical protein